MGTGTQVRSGVGFHHPSSQRCVLSLSLADKPMKGQAYRSLEFTKENQFCDTTVDQVCRKLGLNSKSLGIRQELILWIDPYEVSLRYVTHVLSLSSFFQLM